MNKRKVDNVVQAGVVVTGTLLCILIGWPLSPEGLNQPDHWWFKLINGLIGLILSTLLSGFLLCVLLRKWADFIRSCIILEGLLFCVLLSWPFSNEVIENPLILAFLNGFVGLAGFTVIGLLLRLAPPLVLKRVCVPLIVGAPLVWAFVTFVPFGPKTYQSPPDVFEAAQAASAKRDMEGVMNCLTEESQHTFVEKLVGFFGMMKGFAGLADKALPEPIAKLDNIMKKHGISDKVLEEIEDGSYAVKDKAGLVGDFFKAMDVSKGEELPPLWSSLLQPSGKLEDISIDGDTAVGTAVDGDTRIIIGFIKVGESWLIDLSASGAPAYQANWPDLNPPYEEWKKNPQEWLTSIEILEFMKQYEKTYENFEFLGPSPIDYDTHKAYGECVWEELCEFSLRDNLKEGKTKVGIIFNTDPHTEDGEHWVAMYMDLNKGKLYYFDSYGEEIPGQIEKFADNVIKQANSMKRNNFKKYISKKRHQFSESECGMYCLYFIVEMLKGKPFSKFNGKKKIKDSYMIKLRKLWFNH